MEEGTDGHEMRFYGTGESEDGFEPEEVELVEEGDVGELSHVRNCKSVLYGFYIRLATQIAPSGRRHYFRPRSLGRS